MDKQDNEQVKASYEERKAFDTIEEARDYYERDMTVLAYVPSYNSWTGELGMAHSVVKEVDGSYDIYSYYKKGCRKDAGWILGCMRYNDSRGADDMIAFLGKKMLTNEHAKRERDNHR